MVKKIEIKIDTMANKDTAKKFEDEITDLCVKYGDILKRTKEGCLLATYE